LGIGFLASVSSPASSLWRFSPGEKISLGEPPCPPPFTIQVEKWKGKFLEDEGGFEVLYSGPFPGPLVKPLERGYYRVIFQSEGCKVVRPFLITSVALILHTTGQYFYLEVLERRTGKPVGGVSFSLFFQRKKIFFGLTDAGGRVSLDMVPSGSILRVQKEQDMDELPIEIPSAPETVSLDGVFTVNEKAISMFLRGGEHRSIRIFDSMGRLFFFSPVSSLLQFYLLPQPFYEENEVELEGYGGKPWRGKIFQPGRILLLPPLISEGEAMSYFSRAPQPFQVSLYGVKDGERKWISSYRIFDPQAWGKISLASSLSSLSSLYSSLWFEGDGEEYFWKFTGEEDSSLTSGGIYSLPTSDKKTIYFYMPDGIYVFKPGQEVRVALSEAVEPGFWMSEEWMESSRLRVQQTFVPVANIPPPALTYEPEEGLLGGALLTVQHPEVKEGWLLLTPPSFRLTDFLAGTPPPLPLSTLPVEKHRSFLFSTPGFSSAFSLQPVSEEGKTRISLPPSPGYYRLTLIKPAGASYAFSSRILRVPEGIYSQVRFSSGSDAQERRLEADFLPSTVTDPTLVVRSDVPVRVDLRKGERTSFQRVFQMDSIDPSSPITIRAFSVEGKPLLFSQSIAELSSPASIGSEDFSFLHLLTRSFLPDREFSDLFLLRWLYRFQQPDGGFHFLRDRKKGNVEATAWALLALKALQERGQAVDETVMAKAGAFLPEDSSAYSPFAGAVFSLLLPPGAKTSAPHPPAFPFHFLLGKPAENSPPSSLPSNFLMSDYLRSVFQPVIEGKPPVRCTLFPEEALRDRYLGKSSPAPCTSFSPSLLEVRTEIQSDRNGASLFLSIVPRAPLPLLGVHLRYAPGVEFYGITGLTPEEGMEIGKNEVVFWLEGVKEERDFRISYRGTLMEGGALFLFWSPWLDAGVIPISKEGIEK